MKSRTTLVFALLLSTLASGGCTAIQDFLAPLSPVGTEQPEEAAPALVLENAVDPIDANRFVLDSPEQSIVGEAQFVASLEENTFSLLAREYGLGYDELVEANPGIDPWLPGDGAPILLPTQFVLPNVPREGIVLNIASKRLYYFPKPAEGEPQEVLTFPIGIGRVGWETPLGHSAVVSKATDPHWWVPASVRQEHEELGDPLPAVVPPGPDNPLGRHVLKLDLPGYLIHGTNQPYGVGMRVSHGCVRLYPENIEFLFGLVGVGESVTIVNEPFLVGERDGVFYFEAHPPLADDPIPPEQHLADVVEWVETRGGMVADETIMANLREISAEALGVPMAVTGNPDHELVARARVVKNTVTPDPNMPTLAEVRELLDAAPEDESADADGAAATLPDSDEDATTESPEPAAGDDEVADTRQGVIATPGAEELAAIEKTEITRPDGDE